jgi:hypothetical protein
MLANGACRGGGLGAVAVMMGVESASGGGSASTDLDGELAPILETCDVLREDVVGGCNTQA